MKQLTLLSFACLVALNIAQAQETTDLSRNLVLGGTFGLSIQENNNNPILTSTVINGSFVRLPIETKRSNFSLNPYLGSEVSDHWILGGRGTFALNTIHYTNIRRFIAGILELVEQDRRMTSFGIGVFGRYTVNPDQKLSIYIQNAFDYIIGTERIEERGIEVGKEKYTSFELSAIPGVNWKVSDRFSLLANLGVLRYRNGTWKEELEEIELDFSAFDINFNLSTFRFGGEFRF